MSALPPSAPSAPGAPSALCRSQVCCQLRLPLGEASARARLGRKREDLSALMMTLMLVRGG